MRNQVANVSNKSVNLFDIIGKRRGRKLDGNTSFQIPSLFISFDKNGMNIGYAPTQQQEAHPVVAATPKVKREKRTPGRRGRLAGPYHATSVSTQDMNLTHSMQLIHDTLAKKKRGLTALQLVERLDMPMGTVGWALTRMRERGAVTHTNKKRRVVKTQ